MALLLGTSRYTRHIQIRQHLSSHSYFRKISYSRPIFAFSALTHHSCSKRSCRRSAQQPPFPLAMLCNPKKIH